MITEVIIAEFSSQLEQPFEQYRKEAKLTVQEMAELVAEVADMYRRKAYIAAQQTQEL